MKTNKDLIPKRPAFTQENFFKVLNELDKLNEFIQKYMKLPFWKRWFIGNYIIKKYLNQTK